MGTTWTDEERPLVSLEWDEGSRARQTTVLVMLAVAAVVTALLYLVTTPNYGEPGYQGTASTTEVHP